MHDEGAHFVTPCAAWPVVVGAAMALRISAASAKVAMTMNEKSFLSTIETMTTAFAAGNVDQVMSTIRPALLWSAVRVSRCMKTRSSEACSRHSLPRT